MTYETYIFTPNPDRKRNRLLFLLFACLWFAAAGAFFFLDLSKIAIFGTCAIVIRYFTNKFPFDNDKVSEGRLGDLPIDKLILSENSITFNNRKIEEWELKNVLIYAEDYIGKPKGIFGESHGTDNRIEFQYDNQKYSIRFQVRKKPDLKLINDIALKIESRTSTGGAGFP